MKPVAILGAGPAGLLAAHAVGLAGQPIVVISQPTRDGTSPLKSRLGGAQFLHKPIPELTNREPDTTVTYRVFGDEATYRQKVYGGSRVPFTSFESVTDGMTQSAWNLIGVYDALWESFKESITVIKVDPDWLDKNLDRFRLVLSTVPLPLLCRSRAGIVDDVHAFPVQKVRIHTEALKKSLGDDTIYYDGTRDHAWYRMSRLFGVGGTEWSDQVPKPPVPHLVAKKPIRTSCTCYEGQVVRLGRHGTWTKGVLTHDAFIGALDALRAAELV